MFGAHSDECGRYSLMIINSYTSVPLKAMMQTFVVVVAESQTPCATQYSSVSNMSNEPMDKFK